MILKDGATKIWGSETRVFPVLFAGTWHVGDLVIRTHFVFIIGAAVLLIGVFHVVIGYTRLGLALRAVAENRRVAGDDGRARRVRCWRWPSGSATSSAPPPAP